MFYPSSPTFNRKDLIMSPAQRLVINYIRTKFKLLSAFSKPRAARAAFQLFCTPQSRNRKELPPIFKKAEKLTLTFEGRKLTGYRWNHPSSRKILILHGFESSVINFDRYIVPLTRKGYEVVAFDAPAHGRSEGRTINVLSYRQMITTLAQTYGPFDSFMAHSLGGLSLALALEQIPHTEETRVVFIAPAVETTRAIRNFFHFLQLDPAVLPHFEKVIEEMGGHPSSWYSISRAAEQIRAQVLFVQDKEDALTPYEDVEPLIQKMLPNFQYLITEGLGHSRIYRDNKVTRSIVDFF